MKDKTKIKITFLCEYSMATFGCIFLMGYNYIITDLIVCLFFAYGLIKMIKEKE